MERKVWCRWVPGEYIGENDWVSVVVCQDRSAGG
jgi:hypothetical protein